ncbi:uncharacterized protein LOC116003998 [Ipomoea triloba]|uniref:uncharacterized protein LOC116003998 n=1 Tax=Ipomoea triloba TaxID=35885 RepID=UPI00125E9C86|nr:uncharacterized protein LOC116003998 [Ipomoea triloba]
MLTTPEWFRLYYALEYQFKTSNNEVEYEAVLGGLRLVKALGARRLRIWIDSRLVVSQVKGSYETKRERMQQYKETTEELLKGFQAYEIDHRGSSDKEEVPPEAHILADLIRYKEKVELPDDPVEAARIKRMAPSYVMQDGRLYKRSFRGPYSYPFAEFCKQFGIRHTKVSIAYPQANGQVENVNRTIVDGIQKKLSDLQGNLVSELERVLWVYRTSPRKATGETPFSLTYSFEAKVPLEVLEPSD